ncbi:MAG: PDR/VanB family oxidoreductase [Mycobacteriales bacterium]
MTDPVEHPLGQALTLLVQQVSWEAHNVISLRLVDPSGADLPPWRPGAHLNVKTPSGLVRQYSLFGDARDRSSYSVAVLLAEPGRGGSRELHNSVLVGRTIRVRGPRNHFALEDAPRYLFLAGGIGITPILAMVREVSRREVPWRLVYGGRNRSSMAFVHELQAIGGGNVELVPQEEKGLLDLQAVLRDTPQDTAVYCCGPEGMIRAAEEHCTALLPAGALRIERFGAPKSTARTAAAGPAEPVSGGFEVELRRTGAVLPVPPDRTLLDVVREAVPDVLFSCEDGFCGSCETKVLEGVPEHHDSILTPKEQEKGNTMMICVGRSKSSRLVLDL